MIRLGSAHCSLVIVAQLENVPRSSQISSRVTLINVET